MTRPDPFERLIEQALVAHETLSREERERLRALLAEYAAFRPVRLPIERRVGTQMTRAFGGRAAYVFGSALALLAVGGGGVAYAAQGTLPGDLLYPVKVAITEPIETALTPANEQAAWQITLAERRLAEASTLAKEGRLATSTAASLAEHFSVRAQNAKFLLASTLSASSTASAHAFTIALKNYDTELDSDAGASSTASSTEHHADEGRAHPLLAALSLEIRTWEESGAASSTATTEGSDVGVAPTVSSSSEEGDNPRDASSTATSTATATTTYPRGHEGDLGEPNDSWHILHALPFDFWVSSGR